MKPQREILGNVVGSYLQLLTTVATQFTATMTHEFADRNLVARRLPCHPHATTIFTAVQEQLGLRLVSRKGPVEVIVIDSIEKPSEN